MSQPAGGKKKDPWWKRGVGGAAGNAMIGIDQQIMRSQPPAKEVVQQHSRHQAAVTTGDGGRLIVTLPEQHREFDPQDTRATYDRIARHYADEIAGELANKPFDRAFLDGFAAAVGDGIVVELGCGPGHVAGYLAGRGASVSGLDLSPQMVEQARRLFPAIDFHVGDMLALPLESSSVAGVVSFYSIVHFDEHQTALAFAEMARVLVTGGHLALAFHVGSDAVHRDEWFGEQVNVDFSSHVPDTVRGQLEHAGLAIESLTERDPYPPQIEFQSRRCYIVAVKP